MSKADINTGPEKSYEQRWREASDALTKAERRTRMIELDAGQAILRLRRARDGAETERDAALWQLVAVREALVDVLEISDSFGERQTLPRWADERLRAALPAEAECPKHGQFEGQFCPYFYTDEINYEEIGPCGWEKKLPKCPHKEAAEYWRQRAQSMDSERELSLAKAEAEQLRALPAKWRTGEE